MQLPHDLPGLDLPHQRHRRHGLYRAAHRLPQRGRGQASVDIFGWNQFIALNWPANVATCGPDTNLPIGAPGPRVWETYAADTDIFRASGLGPWCPQNLAALFARPRRFSHMSKASPVYAGRRQQVRRP